MQFGSNSRRSLVRTRGESVVEAQCYVKDGEDGLTQRGHLRSRSVNDNLRHMVHDLETNIAVQQTLAFQRLETKHVLMRINSGGLPQM